MAPRPLHEHIHCEHFLLNGDARAMDRVHGHDALVEVKVGPRALVLHHLAPALHARHVHHGAACPVE